MKARTTIIAGFAVGLTLVAHGQHSPLTSQYLFNGLLINPAYAGSRDALTASLVHRQQWVGFEGAPTTQIMSVHAPIGNRKLGLGVLAYNDHIGVSRESGIMTNYAYRIKFPQGKLAFGIGAGFTAFRADWQQVDVQQQNDISFSAPSTSKLRPNFSTGIYYYTKKYFVGASSPFVLMHGYTNSEGELTIGEQRSNVQPMLTGGYLLELTDDWKLKSSTLLRYRESSGAQADLSANFIFQDKVWLGVSYRSGDAVIGMLEVLPNPQWRLGYSYDMGLSALRPYHYGSHELMVQYEFGYRIRVRDPRYF